MLDAGAIVSAYDSKGVEPFWRLFPAIEYRADPYVCAEGASALAIVTEWEIFRALDLKRLKSVMSDSVLVDFRNIYAAADVQRAGFRYHGIGRAAVA